MDKEKVLKYSLAVPVILALVGVYFLIFSNYIVGLVMILAGNGGAFVIALFIQKEEKKRKANEAQAQAQQLAAPGITPQPGYSGYPAQQGQSSAPGQNTPTPGGVMQGGQGAPPAGVAPSTGAQAQTPGPACDVCNNPTTYIHQYGRHYCHTCKQYK